MDIWKVLKLLADKEIQAEIISIEKLKKDGKKLDYTKLNQHDPNDTVDVIQVNKEKWDSFLEKE